MGHALTTGLSKNNDGLTIAALKMEEMLTVILHLEKQWELNFPCRFITVTYGGLGET